MAHHRFPDFQDLPVYSSTMPSKTSPSKVMWNPDSVHALGLCKIVTVVLGIWPLDTQSLFSKTRLFIVITLQVSMAINLIRALNDDCVAVDDAVDSLGLLAVSAIATVKMTVLQINRAPMKFVMSSILDDWSKVEDPKSRQIMRKHASTGRFVFIFQMSFAYFAITSLILGSLSFNNEQRINNFTESEDFNYSNYFASSLPPFLLASKNSQRSFPMGTTCFDADLPSYLYVLVYLIQSIQLMITGISNIGTDVYFFCVALQVCAQFEILATSFVEFGQDPDVQNCGNELEKLVKKHNHLITLSKKFEDTFNILLLAQLSANAAHMSLLGIRVILGMRTGDSAGVVSSLLAIYVLSLQLFLYSYIGDYLTMRNAKICTAVYYCRWYELPHAVSKDLLFVMSRSNKPFHLTAGKMFHLNLDNFKNLFKAMASYFSMLRIMFEK